MSEHAGKETLSCLIDGQLREDQRLKTETHLQSCSDCRALLKDLRGVSQLLAGLPRAELPAGFMNRLRQRQHQAAAEPKTASPWRYPARTAAFALAGFFAVMTSYELLKKSPEALLNGAESSISDAVPAAAPAAPKPRAKAAGAPMELSEFSEEPKQESVVVTNMKTGAKSAGAEPKTYTNETLYKELEKETQRMGIVEVMPKYSRSAESNYSRWQGITGGSSLLLSRASSPAPLKGARPALLANSAESAIAPGSSLVAASEEDPLEDGAVVRSEESLGLLWNRLQRPGAPPQADFNKEMLLFILGGGTRTAVEFAGIQESEGRLQVLYRESKKPGAAFFPYRTVPRSELPVEFQKAP